VLPLSDAVGIALTINTYRYMLWGQTPENFVLKRFGTYTDHCVLQLEVNVTYMSIKLQFFCCTCNQQ